MQRLVVLGWGGSNRLVDRFRGRLAFFVNEPLGGAGILARYVLDFFRFIPVTQTIATERYVGQRYGNNDGRQSGVQPCDPAASYTDAVFQYGVQVFPELSQHLPG